VDLDRGVETSLTTFCAITLIAEMSGEGAEVPY